MDLGDVTLQKSDSLTNGILGQFSDAVDVQLVHDLLAVGFHRFHADVKFRGYFLGGFALGNELENFSFPL